LPHQLAVKHAHPPGCNRTHGKLLIPRHAKLPHDKDIERRIQRLRNLIPDRNSATRERENDYVSSPGKRIELFRQLAASIGTVAKASVHEAVHGAY
jgi:hypothetical protein